jgi:hypothetical protein
MFYMPSKFLVINIFSNLPLQTHKDFFKRRKKQRGWGGEQPEMVPNKYFPLPITVSKF